MLQHKFCQVHQMEGWLYADWHLGPRSIKWNAVLIPHDRCEMKRTEYIEWMEPQSPNLQIPFTSWNSANLWMNIMKILLVHVSQLWNSSHWRSLHKFNWADRINQPRVQTAECSSVRMQHDGLPTETIQLRNHPQGNAQTASHCAHSETLNAAPKCWKPLRIGKQIA
jgi:hypothetical protein